MGALELFLSWQAIVLAVVVVTVSGGIKSLVDVAWPGGKEARRRNRWMTRIILPALPLVLGLVAGMLIPIRPEAVVEYVTEHVEGGWSWIAYGGWGLVAGGVAGDYLYTKFKNFLTHESGS